MLTIQPSVAPVGAPVVDAGARLDVHTVESFVAAVDNQLRRFGAVHIDASAVKHCDKAGIAALTTVAELRRPDVEVTIDANPAVQVTALLERNEMLAAIVLPQPDLRVAA